MSMTTTSPEGAVIVTGAASGIGQATALRIARDRPVVCADRNSPDDTCRQIDEAGGTAIAVRFDVGDLDDWQRICAEAEQGLGPITALANVAGHGGRVDTALGINDDGWDRIMRSNLRGMWYGMRTVLPRMIEAGHGHIVNVASTAGVVGVPNTFAYAAAKGGIIAMSRQVATEYGRSGIRCNSVVPGITATPGLRALPDTFLAAMAGGTASGVIAQPSEVGEVIAFLCSRVSTVMNGATVNVDGGTTIYGAR